MEQSGSKWLRAALCALLAAGSGIAAADFTGRVVGVSDGDTIKVLRDGREVRIRIVGIDAPEKKQPFGERAKQAMSKLVFGRPVRIEERKTDRYGRILGRVLVGGTDAGLELIGNGLAWHYKAYQREQPRGEAVRYSNTELGARQRRAGLWSDAAPVPPWDWRKSRRTR